MDANNRAEVAYDCSPFLLIYTDGRVERLMGIDFAPPSIHPTTGVQSKDIQISEQDNISARLYLPKVTNLTQKLPLLVYFHGGAFCIGTPFDPSIHNFLNTLVAESNVAAVSVGYRLAPDHPLPIAYEDSWLAIEWAASHKEGKGSEEWLNNHADFERMFFIGDSAGANIAHHMAIKFGEENLGGGVKLKGLVLNHPYFWGKEPVGKEPVEPEKRFYESLWALVCPTTSGCDNRFINPGLDPKVKKLGCKKVLVFVAEEDLLRDRGWHYKEVLANSRWEGDVEVMEIEGEGHVCHIQKPCSEAAVTMLRRTALFFK